MHDSTAAGPRIESLAGSSPGRVVKRLLLATRPMFFPASVLPVLLGASWGYHVAGAMQWAALALALGAVICVHAGANVLNDVFDDLSGADRGNEQRIFPFTGGSRFIQNGIMRRREMALWGGVLLAVGALFGAMLIAVKGLGVLWYGLVGIALGVSYSMPPIQLSARGLGELAVAVAFGVLPVTGTAWLQSGELNLAALLISLPISCWVANILLINEVPDARADGAADKRTLVVRYGPAFARRLYLGLNIAALGVGVIAVIAGLISAYALLGLGALLLAAIGAARTIGAGSAHLERGIKLSLMIHLAGGLWLSALLLI